MLFNKIYQAVIDRIGHYDFFDTLKHTSVYFSANIIINALGIISIPIYTYFLDTKEYGIVEIFINTVKILAVLLTLNTHQAVGRYYYEGKKDWPSFLGASFLTSAFLILFLGSIFILLKDEIISLLNIPDRLFYLIFPAIIVLVITTIFNHLFIARKDSVIVSKYQILLSYGKFAGAVICLLLITPGYYAKIIGDILVGGVLGVFMFRKIYPFVKWNILKQHLKYILVFSLPLIPYSLSGFILNFFDLFMINSSSNAEAGLYAFSYKISMLLFGLNQALQNAANPDFYKWMNNKNYGEILNQIKSMLKFLTIGASFLILFAQDLGHLLASKESFTIGLHLVPILVVGLFIYSIYSFYSRLLFYSKRTFYISAITILAGIMNIVLNSIYIPQYGYVAAAYTTLASYLFLVILAAFVAVGVFKYPAPPLKQIILSTLTISMVAIAAHFLLETEISFLLAFLTKSIIFITLFLILFGSKLIAFIKND